MGLFPDHHLIYAVVLYGIDMPTLKSIGIPKNVKICSHNEKLYLEVAVCDNDDLLRTKYYKKKRR